MKRLSSWPSLHNKAMAAIQRGRVNPAFVSGRGMVLPGDIPPDV